MTHQTTDSDLKHQTSARPCGLMDKALDFGSRDCEFESRRGRTHIFFCFFFFSLSLSFVFCYLFVTIYLFISGSDKYQGLINRGMILTFYSDRCRWYNVHIKVLLGGTYLCGKHPTSLPCEAWSMQPTFFFFMCQFFQLSKWGSPPSSLERGLPLTRPNRAPAPGSPFIYSCLKIDEVAGIRREKCGVTRKPLTLEGMGDLVHRVMK